MSKSVNLSTIPCNVPSICIPRVFPNITQKRIRDTFDQLDFGTISSVDIVPKQNKDGKKYNIVFVHFLEWNDTSVVMDARERLLAGNSVKIIYDEPWFWNVSALKDSVPQEKKNYKASPVSASASSSINVPTRRIRPTRTISAEECGAYDYDHYGNLVPYSQIVSSRKFIDNIKKQELIEEPGGIPGIWFPDDECECCRCIGLR
jgi:hypothetical protein